MPAAVSECAPVLALSRRREAQHRVQESCLHARVPHPRVWQTLAGPEETGQPVAQPDDRGEDLEPDKLSFAL